MTEVKIGQLYAVIDKLMEENKKLELSNRAYKGHETRQINKNHKHMTEIKTGVNVPVDEPVFALNRNAAVIIGFLSLNDQTREWECTCRITHRTIGEVKSFKRVSHILKGI